MYVTPKTCLYMHTVHAPSFFLFLTHTSKSNEQLPFLPVARPQRLEARGRHVRAGPLGREGSPAGRLTVRAGQSTHLLCVCLPLCVCWHPASTSTQPIHLPTTPSNIPPPPRGTTQELACDDDHAAHFKLLCEKIADPKVKVRRRMYMYMYVYMCVCASLTRACLDRTCMHPPTHAFMHVVVHTRPY